MNDKLIGNEKNILFYNDEDGNTQVEVLLENEDVWLNTEFSHNERHQRRIDKITKYEEEF